jgi:nucleoside-diphosphate-sugar epimerase
MNILIIGASGYIGSIVAHLTGKSVQKLDSQGY